MEVMYPRCCGLASNTLGKSGRAILGAMIGGEESTWRGYNPHAQLHSLP